MRSGGSTGRTRHAVVIAATLASATAVAACAGEGASPAASAAPAAVVDHVSSAFHGTTVDMPRPQLTLRDTSGRRFSLAERPRGEVMVLFFGYTHCPDICPTTMADLAAAKRMLSAAVRDRVTVVFVTEDPKRDRPGVLRTWLDRFDPSFIGLLGGNAATRKTLDTLYLPRTKRVATPSPAVIHPDDGHEHPGAYGIAHAGSVYAFGPGATVVYTGGTTPDQFAQDMSRLAG